MMKLLITTLLCFLCLPLLAQNRFLVSQYMYNGLVLNPAYAGSQHKFSLAGLYRNQWLNVEGAPSYQMVSAHTPMASNRIGVGVLFTSEQVGVHRDYAAFAMAAYKVKLPNGYLSMGLSGGVNVKNSDYASLRLVAEDDPYLTGRIRKASPNFGVGVYFCNAKAYAGVSVPYLLSTTSFQLDGGVTARLREPRTYYLTGGLLLGRDDVVQFNPSMLIRMRAQSPIGLDANMNFILREKVILGASYRLGASLVLLSQFILNDNFRVMYAYDFTTSRLANRARGTHEIMINYRIFIRALDKDPHCSAYF